MRRTIQILPALVSCFVLSTARADDQLSMHINFGPIAGASNDSRSIVFNAAARTKARLFDSQDAQSHFVRGVPLAELIKQISAPKQADTIVFHFTNGMQVPVLLVDKDQIKEIFVAFEHGDAMGTFATVYPLAGKASVPCPKIVFQRSTDAFSFWTYATQLTSIQFVSWNAWQAILAQPTRQPPSHGGWNLYAKNCQPCHGMGGQGAQRAPDFLSDLDAYRRIPALLETSTGEQPSLHDKVRGRAGGQMPTLTHVSNTEIAQIWRWLHSIHDSAVK